MRYRSLWAACYVALAVSPGLHAQEPTTPEATPRTDALRERVRERFAQRVQQELDLTPEQMGRLRATAGTYAGERRDLELRQRTMRDALARQLRPGATASQDSVARLTDSLLALRVRYAESFQAEQAELARYLDPVQRARLWVMRERLLVRARELRHRRQMDR
jgi:hypothetical protein